MEGKQIEKKKLPEENLGGTYRGSREECVGMTPSPLPGDVFLFLYIFLPALDPVPGLGTAFAIQPLA